MRNKVNYIINWLNDYVVSSNTGGFIVGVSGGIDSALTSTLCAMTGKKTICVSLPINQNYQEVIRANKHIDWLKRKYSNVESIEIDLSVVYDNFKLVFPIGCHTNLNLANFKSRLRMISLYFLGGPEKLLVVGTGNKIEDFGIGFFTKYGDGGVDLSPIADLLKSEVYELAKFLDINYEIISAQPTDGLFESGSTDEDQIGATYDELEWAMYFVESNQESENLTKRQSEVLKIYLSLNSSNSHKMNAVPFCKIPKNLN